MGSYTKCDNDRTIFVISHCAKALLTIINDRLNSYCYLLQRRVRIYISKRCSRKKFRSVAERFNLEMYLCFVDYSRYHVENRYLVPLKFTWITPILKSSRLRLQYAKGFVLAAQFWLHNHMRNIDYQKSKLKGISASENISDTPDLKWDKCLYPRKSPNLHKAYNICQKIF